MNLGCKRGKHLDEAARYADMFFDPYVMRKVCVHDDHKVSSDEIQAMDICSSVFTY